MGTELENRSVVAPSVQADYCTATYFGKICGGLAILSQDYSSIQEFWLFQNSCIEL